MPELELATVNEIAGELDARPGLNFVLVCLSPEDPEGDFCGMAMSHHLSIPQAKYLLQRARDFLTVKEAESAE